VGRARTNPGNNVDTWLAGRDLADTHSEVVRHREESTPKGIALFSPQGSGDHAEWRGRSGSWTQPPSHRWRVNLENCIVA
jgi:hypothetical protein